MFSKLSKEKAVGLAMQIQIKTANFTQVEMDIWT